MPTVLVTGASRGIGRAVVVYLAGRGWDVVAGVRGEADAASVSAIDPHRVTPVLLDITDDAHVADLDDALPETLDAVVNNAGAALGGPIEVINPADWRKVFDVNLFGQLAVTRAVLPRLRASRGRVVFVSSVNGRLAVPMLGAYSASKFALEAAADAMRMELRPWGIRVVLVEPAQTDTDMWRTADAMVDDAESAMADEYRELYAGHIAGMRRLIPTARRLTVPAVRVAKVVDRALTADRPRTRYVVGAGPKMQIAVMTNLPAPVRDRVLSVISGVPRRR